ncbi:hypothetical protein QBC32DRAFT_339417 [Pseudoneurospora amorphoporcata]|uniref:Uncharacterized protein n=1 Tax=Pseudoneurospora amorphoporcata TaxID=241081 RepID=A0AAN6NW89_9PEZI|nr:hypothetical protein QBC32DRAFT_339417 [Pseudoneurospora amorphoporcata]
METAELCAGRPIFFPYFTFINLPFLVLLLFASSSLAFTRSSSCTSLAPPTVIDNGSCIPNSILCRFLLLPSSLPTQ